MNKPRKFKRRHFILGGLLGLPSLVCADANWCEPKWLKVQRIRLTAAAPSMRFVYFTGDLIEEAHYLPETLELLSRIKSPLYGCPGNHDYWSRADFAEIGKSFAATGGAWLLDQYAMPPGKKVSIAGLTCLNWKT